jgi:hypothetical protein
MEQDYTKLADGFKQTVTTKFKDLFKDDKNVKSTSLLNQFFKDLTPENVRQKIMELRKAALSASN